MLTDRYLSEVVEESGRREITIGMVVEAERRRSRSWGTGIAEGYHDAIMAQQRALLVLGRHPQWDAMAAQAQQNHFGGTAAAAQLTTHSILGAAFGFPSRYPTCGR